MIAGGETRNRPAFRPVPPGVVELSGWHTSADGDIVELHDGSWFLAQGGGINDQSFETPVYRTSKDEGKTWSAPQPLNSPIGVGGLIRLKSGRLAIYGRKFEKGFNEFEYYFSSSPDEGKTWSSPTLISNYPDYRPMFHSMLQLTSGRLLIAGYWLGFDGGEKGPASRMTISGWGYWRGKILFLDGERGVWMGICVMYYSDDEGTTWKPAQNGLYGWFDEWGIQNGAGGFIGLYEPSMAQTKDGKVLLFARARVGRLVQSYSLDNGFSWYAPEPTELASSQSPPLLTQIPKTGDLLCVWNQVSLNEMNRGFLRGRLSSAISRDNGVTWEHFKTIELSPEGMEDVARLAPLFPIPRQLEIQTPFGNIPDGVALFCYPNVDIVGDKVIIRYDRWWATERPREKKKEANPSPAWISYEDREAEMAAEGVVRVYPLDWFYQ
jgi:hypothetical protein